MTGRMPLPLLAALLLLPLLAAGGARADVDAGLGLGADDVVLLGPPEGALARAPLVDIPHSLCGRGEAAVEVAELAASAWPPSSEAGKWRLRVVLKVRREVRAGANIVLSTWAPGFPVPIKTLGLDDALEKVKGLNATFPLAPGTTLELDRELELSVAATGILAHADKFRPQAEIVAKDHDNVLCFAIN